MEGWKVFQSAATHERERVLMGALWSACGALTSVCKRGIGSTEENRRSATSQKSMRQPCLPLLDLSHAQQGKVRMQAYSKEVKQECRGAVAFFQGLWGGAH